MRLWPFRRSSRASSTLADPSPELFDALGSVKTSSGQRVSIEGALGLVAVYACVSKVAETIGSLPLKVYQQFPDGEVQETPEHRAYRMLHDMPNPSTPAPRFWSATTARLLLWGNAFIRKLRDEASGLVTEIHLLDSAQMRVYYNVYTGLKRYEYTYPDGSQLDFQDDDILHVTDFSLDGVIGLSRIEKCRESFGTVQARQQFEGSFYAQGAVQRGVIEHPGTLKDTTKLRESWTAVYGGSARAHQVGVLEEGATFRGLSMPLSDLQFVETARLSNTEVAVLFGLPPAYIGGSTGDSLTYQTVEGNRLQFADAIAPICTNIASALATDRGIFPFSKWFPEFELKALMRGDSQARSVYYEKALAGGWMTVDEVRALENLPPLPSDTADLGAAPEAQGAAPAPGAGAPPAANGQTTLVKIPAHTRRPPTTGG